MLEYHQVTVAASSLPLPSAESFITQVRDTAFPNMFALSAAGLGCVVAIMLIRSLRK